MSIVAVATRKKCVPKEVTDDVEMGELGSFQKRGDPKRGRVRRGGYKHSGECNSVNAERSCSGAVSAMETWIIVDQHQFYPKVVHEIIH